MSKPNGTLIAAVALVAVAGSVALGACNPSGGSQLPIPSISASQLPALEVPTSSAIAMSGACLDPATFAILDRLQQQGVDVPTLLANNKTALISGLGAFQPQDEATAAWRDELVADLQANDLAKAATQIRMLTTAEVAVASC